MINDPEYFQIAFYIISPIVVDGRDKLSQKWSFKSEPLRWSSWERML